MSDFFEHVLGELKGGRISREVALDLLSRHATRLSAQRTTAERATQSSTPAIASSPGATSNDAPDVSKQRSELLVFTEEWRREALQDATDASIRRIVCLVHVDVHSAATSAFAAVAPHLDVTFIAASADLALATENRSRFAAALGEMRERVDRIDALLYLGNPQQPATAAAAEDILALLQGLRDAQLPCDRLLLCGTYDDALSRCHAESWIGIERSLRVLSPRMQAAVLLMETASGSAALQSRVAIVVRELCAERLQNVNYFAQERHALRLQPFEPAANAGRLRKGETYLITGGAGALGLMFAEHLWRDYAANLILTGRGTLDPARAAQIELLRSEGAQVVYEAVDAADLEGMRLCVQRARSRFGAIHGAIHAAGVQGQGLIFDNGIERVRQVLRPKVQGTLVLDEALRECPEVRFICCFSSTAAVLGDFGSCDYALANRFQMAYAQQAGRGSQRLLLAIGWPFWSGGAMGSSSDSQRTRLYLNSSGQRALEPRFGLHVFEQILQGESGFRLVMCGDAQRLRTSLGVPDLSAQDQARRAPAEAAVASGRRVAMRGLSIEQCVAWDLTDQISELLKLPRAKILPRQNLAEYGFDSITLARWAKRISQHYAVELTPAVFFSHPTLLQVVEYLLQHHARQLQEFYHESEQPGAAASQATATEALAPTIEPQPPRDEAAASEPIAIVGMSGRFPQAQNVEELWQILVNGRNAVTEIPLQRFDWRNYFGAQGGDNELRMVSKWLGVLPGVDEFDPLFFEISPREAQNMDPRQRLLLQEAWQALEDAGYGELQLQQQKIAMFVGAEQGEYQLLAGPHSTLTGNHDAILASRLSYVLDLQGAAMAINTSCSSGLVAAHQACLSLRAKDCDAAIAAGVNLVLTPHPYLGMSRAGMLSEDGKCFAFDRRANGMVPGEAVVAVVLKRLSSARAAGDPVHAVIVASGINYDGKTNGITAPNGAAQAKLIEATYARAKISPEDIEYVVAHGTGTRLGDPVEVGALDRVFGAHGSKRGYCALTSTKSNLGHTFAASGLVSLVSLVLALRHETIPASLHCEQLSDYIDWSRSAFYVNCSAKSWPKGAERRRVGAVSAFGMSGTNAHMVVQDCDDTAARFVATAPAFLLALSATTETALRQRVSDLIGVLRDEPNVWNVGRLAALSHTLLAHRQHFAHRCAVIVEDREQALALLEAAQGDERSPAAVRGKVPADFAERPALKEYAENLLRTLTAQESERSVYRESLGALADLYCQGYRLGWQAIYQDRPPQRLRLPAYPFAKQHYWFDAGNEQRSADAAAAGDVGTQQPAAGALTVGVQYVVPRWDAVDASQLARTSNVAFSIPSERPLVVGGGILARAYLRSHYPQAVLSDISCDDDIATITDKLEKVGDFDHVIWIAPQSPVATDEQLIGVQHQGVLHAFRLSKALLARGDAARDLAWTVVTFQAVEVHKGAVIDPAHAGVHGLVGSMAKEYPRWSIRMLDLESDADWHVSRWPSVPADARARPWAYREGRWHKLQLLAARASRPPATASRTGNVYVVIGGAGHVGTAWSEHVIREQQAQVIWLGRRPKDARIQASIDRLAALGVAPKYMVADAADAGSLEQAYRQIKGSHERIDGVVLSSIHLDPRGLQDMDEAHFQAALRAKVDTSVRVIEVFGGEPLQLVLFFSSVISFIRNPLQSAYAAGCAFADAYARALRQRWSAPAAPAVKIMNWGFWDRPENLQLEGFAKMAQMGIGLIEPAEAMAALECLLHEPIDQMGVVKITKPVLIEGMSPRSAIAIYAERSVLDMAQLRDRVHTAAATHEKLIAQWSAT